MKMVSRVTLVGSVLLSLGLAACSDDSDDSSPSPTPTPTPVATTAGGKSIVELAAATPSLSTLVKLVTLCKLEGALKEASAKTVFAPNNDAFAKAFPTAPTSCTDAVKATLLYHVVGKKVAAKDVTTTEASLDTASGSLFALKDGVNVVINGKAKVVTADVAASNGVVHVIDTVLVPDSLGTVVDLAAKRQQFSTLVALVGLCDLAGTLSDASKAYTVFAPTNDAFKAYLGSSPAPTACNDALKTTLLTHVLGAKVLSKDLAATQAADTAASGEKVFITKDTAGVKVNGAAKVIAADVGAGNGVVHVIDKVLVPDAQGTVVDALSKRYEHTTLVSSVVSAGLAQALATTPNLTVFAPTNAAFEAIASTVAGLSTSALTSVLQSHVLAEKILAANIPTGDTQKDTLLTGKPVTISKGTSGVTVKSVSNSSATPSPVTATDIVTSNGVIHVLSSVIVPTLP